MSRNLVAVALVAIGMLMGACANRTTTFIDSPQPQTTPAFTPPPSPTAPPALAFEIQGENLYEDPVGSLRLLFEVRNLNPLTVEDLRVTVTLRDAGGETVASQFAHARLNVLRAGDSAPAMVVFFLGAPGFSSYEVGVYAEEGGYLAGLLHPGLEIVDDLGRVGEWVPYEVLGQVQNVGASDAESVTLVVTCYDEDGRVVAIGSGAPKERTIPAGGSSEFLVSIGALAGEIASYKVQVQGLVINED
jgi:hypothetical protein